MAKKPIKITEVVLRDAHQSLLATRMTMDDMRPILPEMDKIPLLLRRVLGAVRLSTAASASSMRTPGSVCASCARSCPTRSCRCCSAARTCWATAPTLAFLAGSALLFQKAYVGYFSWVFPADILLFLHLRAGPRGRHFYQPSGLSLGDGLPARRARPRPAALYGESFVLRFPFLYICILGVAYIIMFSIQRYWVDKAKRHLLLQQRIDAEKGKLSEMSLKVITAMYSALSSKIPEIDLHCQQTAELTQEMARRMGLDEAACRDGYYAGLLHEVGTVGLPDDVVLQRNITRGAVPALQDLCRAGAVASFRNSKS